MTSPHDPPPVVGAPLCAPPAQRARHPHTPGIAGHMAGERRDTARHLARDTQDRRAISQPSPKRLASPRHVSPSNRILQLQVLRNDAPKLFSASTFPAIM